MWYVFSPNQLKSIDSFQVLHNENANWRFSSYIFKDFQFRNLVHWLCFWRRFMVMDWIVKFHYHLDIWLHALNKIYLKGFFYKWIWFFLISELDLIIFQRNRVSRLGYGWWIMFKRFKNVLKLAFNDLCHFK